MANPSYTYTLTNGTTADAAQVMQNFNDILAGVTDGTKDLSISALTVAGTASFNGNVTLGNATGDDITFTGRLASNLVPKTTNTYNIGSADIGVEGIYFGTSDTDTARIISAALAADRTYTLPDAGGAADFIMSAGAQSKAGLLTLSTGLAVPTSGASGNVLAQGATPSQVSAEHVNVGSMSLTSQMYYRIGSFVIVWGSFDLTPTAAAPTTTRAGISIPIAANFTGGQDVYGILTCEQSSGAHSGIFTSSSANDCAVARFTATSTGSKTYCYAFAYQII